eukprot:209226_1
MVLAYSFFEFPALAIRIDTQTFFYFQPFVIMDDIFVFTRCLSISVLSMRLYLMYYDHEYTRTLTGDSWRILIDPNIEKTNWFLAHRPPICVCCCTFKPNEMTNTNMANI